MRTFWLLLLASCARPVAAPVHLAVVAAPPPPAPVATEKPAPPPPAKCAYDVRTASQTWDFHVETARPCRSSDVADCGAATLAIRDKHGSEVQTLSLESLCLVESAPGALLANSAALYDSQGTILVGDFDFDGREDFAVQVGEDGPYGGPTFDVYLGGSGGFALSPKLSALTRETLGFFEVDAKNRHLVTRSKSGCCWHQTEVLEVHGGVPTPVERYTEDATDPNGAVVVDTEEKLVRGKWVRTVKRRKP